MIDDLGMAALMDIELELFLKLKIEGRTPDIGYVNNLLGRLNVSLSNFFEQKMDLLQVQESFLGNVKALPSKYSYAKFSNSRTIINCLDYLKERFGDKFIGIVFRELQVDFRFFEQPNRWVNINFSKDLCAILRGLGLRENDFFEMGRTSYLSNYNTPLGKSLSKHKNVEDLFEDICVNHSQKFDKNFEYFITRVDKNSIFIGSAAKEGAVEKLKDKVLISSDVCTTKMGVFATFSNYIGKKSTIKKSKCAVSGDSYSEFKIVYE